MNIEDIKLLPSNNLKAEKAKLAKLDWTASNVARCRNFRFTVKLLCYDVMLSKRNNDKVEVPVHETFKQTRNMME